MDNADLDGLAGVSSSLEQPKGQKHKVHDPMLQLCLALAPPSIAYQPPCATSTFVCPPPCLRAPLSTSFDTSDSRCR